MTALRPKSIFYIALVFFALLVVVAAWFYRNDVFRYVNDPGQPFQTYAPPAAPDYTSPDSWLAYPQAQDVNALDPAKADIFVVGPTLHLGGKNWVADIFEGDYRRKTDHFVAPNYVRPYAIGGRVYAPHYRQAALYSFLTNRDDARRAQKFAYDDIETAFRIFLKQSPPERPIVIIGHGQGGLHVQNLLQNEMTMTARKKLAVVYIIDHPTPIFALGGTPLCQTAAQTSCAVTFTTVAENEDILAGQYATKTLFFKDKGLHSMDGKKAACVNPLLWAISDDYAPARLHKGAIAASGLPEGTNAPAADRQFGAQCEDGLLVIDKPRQYNLRKPRRFGGHYRTPPYNLFSEDIRQNMLVRIKARLDAGDLPRRAPALKDMDMIDVDDVPITPAD